MVGVASVGWAMGAHQGALSLRLSCSLLVALSHSTTCSTGELNGADDSVLSVDDFETFEAEGTDLDGLTKTKLRNVDEELLGDLRVRSAYLELTHFDSVSDGGELEVLEDSLDLTAIDVEVDSEDVWRVDEVTYAILAYGEVEYFVASVEDCGDLITSAEALSGLLTELVAELA